MNFDQIKVADLVKDTPSTIDEMSLYPFDRLLNVPTSEEIKTLNEYRVALVEQYSRSEVVDIFIRYRSEDCNSTGLIFLLKQDVESEPGSEYQIVVSRMMEYIHQELKKTMREKSMANDTDPYQPSNDGSMDNSRIAFNNRNIESVQEQSRREALQEETRVMIAGMALSIKEAQEIADLTQIVDRKSAILEKATFEIQGKEFSIKEMFEISDVLSTFIR